MAYKSAEYGEAYKNISQLHWLGKCGSYLLRRPIDGMDREDLAGLYPLFDCRDWKYVADDFDSLKGKFVSIVAVVNPFAAVKESELGRIFTDYMQVYKKHYVATLGDSNANAAYSAHHRRNIRYAREKIRVVKSQPSAEIAENWVVLYSNLIRRHNIVGLTRFDEHYLRAIINVPGIDIFTAYCDDVVVGVVLWMHEDDNVYYHLAAYSELGYATKASYAVFDTAFEYYKSIGVRRVLLGGVADSGPVGDGLARFKKGWATEEVDVLLCGKILNQSVYEELVVNSGVNGQNNFFPQYRSIIR